jgi:hypothetical protein
MCAPLEVSILSPLEVEEGVSKEGLLIKSSSSVPSKCESECELRCKGLIEYDAVYE